MFEDRRPSHDLRLVVIVDASQVLIEGLDLLFLFQYILELLLGRALMLLEVLEVFEVHFLFLLLG